MDNPKIDSILEQAEIFRLSGNYEPAIPLYKQILEQVADHHGATLGLAHCYLNTGLFDESLEHFKKAAEICPHDIKTLMDLAKAYLMLGHFDEGKETFLQVLAIDPDNEEAKKQLSYFEAFES